MRHMQSQRRSGPTTTSRRRFLGGLAATGLGLTGAGALLRPGGVEALSQNTVTVQAGWINDAEWAGFFYAQRQGYYTQLGLKQIWVPGGPTIDARQVVAAGRAQIGDTGGVDYILAFRAQGAPVVAFGALFQRSPVGLISLASKPIRTPKDVVGKRIGVPAVSTQAWNIFLLANDLSPDQITVVTVGSDPAVLSSGQIDALLGYVTEQPLTLAREGIKTVFLYFSDWGGYPYTDLLFCTEDTLARHEDALVAWMKASIKGWQAVIKDPAAGVAATFAVGAAPGLKRDDQLTLLKAQIPLMQSAVTREKGLFALDPALWHRGMQTMLRTKQLKAPLDVSKAFTTRITDQAHV